MLHTNTRTLRVLAQGRVERVTPDGLGLSLVQLDAGSDVLAEMIRAQSGQEHHEVVEEIEVGLSDRGLHPFV